MFSMGASVVIAVDVGSVSHRVTSNNAPALIPPHVPDRRQFAAQLWRFLVGMVARPQQMESILERAQHTGDTRDTESTGIVGVRSLG